jgi:hypothetical protein
VDLVSDQRSFAYPAEFAKPLILGIEVAMILTIAATLALLLAGAPERSA